MQDTETLAALRALIHLDIDAVYAYKQAIDHAEAPLVRDQLMRCQSDHERHIAQMSALMRTYGGEPPPFTWDLKGLLLAGITALRGLRGTHGVLRAMRLN